MNEKTPRLLKKRQFHSRMFAVAAIFFVFVSSPMMPAGQFPRECMLWLGYALIIIGAMGRAYCSVFIGGRKNDEVIRSGPFSVVRNPLYVFSFIALVGVGLQSGMFILLALLVAAFTAYYPMVVAKEEAFLLDKFGETYENYLREVPRWKPNFKLWNEPTHSDCQPKFIRKTLMDASVFFLAMPIFSFIHTLQAHEVIPVWFMLP